MARYALVIGIAEYQSPSLPRLSKTTNDAESVARLLEEHGGFQVKRLPGRFNPDTKSFETATGKVTGAQLGQELRTFLLEQATKNEALIYFTGHGFIVSDNLGQTKGFLATSDCVVETDGNRIFEQKHGIALDSLNQLIAASQLSSLVVILDCCHSASFLERKLVEQTFTAFNSEQRDYYLMTACRSFEQARAIKSEEHSVFTGVMLKGLSVENASSNRRVSGDRLFDYIHENIRRDIQEPIRMGWGRSINLVTYPAVSQATVSTPQPTQPSQVEKHSPENSTPEPAPQPAPTANINNNFSISSSPITNLTGSGNIIYNEAANKSLH